MGSEMCIRDSLCGAITSAADRSPRQTRHLSFVAEYTTDIRHVAGETNVVADALSRPSDVPLSLEDVPDALVLPALSPAVNALRLCPGVDFAALSASQSAQPDLLDTAGSLRVVQLPIPGSPDTKLWCDVSLGWPRPLVPRADVPAVFDCVHGISHAGGKATLKEVSRRLSLIHI